MRSRERRNVRGGKFNARAFGGKTSSCKQQQQTFRREMATCQKQRSATGTWSTIFPSEQVTYQQSTLFVKKLLAVAVSNISYLRTIFPEHAFGDRCLEDLNLKILRDDSSCPGACQVIRWMKGCFDALDKKYLQTIVIGIYKDPEDPNTVIESYTFKFSYGDGVGLDIYRNGSKLAAAYSEAETKKATIKLLRTIVVLTQTLKPLPDDVMMTMKLLYYDDVTPADYQPPGFSIGDQEEFNHIDEVVNIAVGDVATPFHLVKLRIHTSTSQFELPAPSEDPTLQQQVDEADTVKTQPAAPEPSLEVPMDTAAQLPEEEAHMPAVNGPAVESPTIESDHTPLQADGGIRCPCGCNEDDGLMILCGACSVWQHGVCFGLLKEEEVPQLHICEQCAQTESQEGGRQCTDPFLQYLNGMSLQTTCLFRRALLAASETSKISPSDLIKRLGVEKSTAQGLVNRLEREGFVSGVKGKRVTRTVYKDKLKAGISRFMISSSSNKIAPPCSTKDSIKGSVKDCIKGSAEGCLKGSAKEVVGEPPLQSLPLAQPQPQALAGPKQQGGGLESQLDCSMEDLAAGTLNLSLHKTRAQAVIEAEQLVRRSPRIAKRARALLDQDAEFDLASSQDQWELPKECSDLKKRKISVAKKSILV